MVSRLAEQKLHLLNSLSNLRSLKQSLAARSTVLGFTGNIESS
jgi:hypothetical protein